MGTTANFGWEYPDDGSDVDIWGPIETALYQAIDARMKIVADAAASAAAAAVSAVTTAAPTGTLAAFDMAAAPAGWVRALGNTIGDASSNATERANADTSALFTLIWTQFDNTLRPIVDSAGAPSTRGASAAADFAAHKALPLANIGDRVIRAWVSGGVGPGLGGTQEDAFQGHDFSIALRQTSGGGTTVASSDGTGSSFTGSTGSIVTDGINGTPRTASETRVKSYGALVCCKL